MNLLTFLPRAANDSHEFVTRAEFVALYPTTDTPTQYVDKLYLQARLTQTQQEPAGRNRVFRRGGCGYGWTLFATLGWRQEQRCGSSSCLVINFTYGLDYSLSLFELDIFRPR